VDLMRVGIADAAVMDERVYGIMLKEVSLMSGVLPSGAAF
jgi:hypothetical protein